MKLESKIALLNMLLRDVNEELQMYFIAYEYHNPATGHLTKQDRNPNIFENNWFIKSGFFLYVLFVVNTRFCGRQNHISCEVNLLWFLKMESNWMYWSRINLSWFWFIFLLMFNNRQMAFLALGSCFLFDIENDGLPVCVDTWYIKKR